MLKGPTCTTGLNGPGDDKTRYALYRKHHWRPLIYRWSYGSVSRTFRVVEEGVRNEPYAGKMVRRVCPRIRHRRWG